MRCLNRISRSSLVLVFQYPGTGGRNNDLLGPLVVGAELMAQYSITRLCNHKRVAPNHATSPCAVTLRLTISFRETLPA